MPASQIERLVLPCGGVGVCVNAPLCRHELDAALEEGDGLFVATELRQQEVRYVSELEDTDTATYTTHNTQRYICTRTVPFRK